MCTRSKGIFARLALGQAVLDDLAGLRRDPVRKLHLELHQQVATLGRALGQGQAFAPQAPDGARFDDVAARHRHHPAVEGGDVNGAAAQSLERRRKKQGECDYVGRLFIEAVS